MTLNRRIVAAACALAAAGLACAEQSSVRRGDDLMERGQFEEAEREYRKAQVTLPNDSSVNSKIRQAQISQMFQEALKLHFDGELAKANMLFHEIAGLAPGTATGQEWLKKSDRDISRQLTQEGKDYLGVRSYEAAIQSFEKALQFDPNNEDAKDALERSKTILKWRADKGTDLWKTGLLEATQGHPIIAETSVQNSLDLTPNRANADDFLSDIRTTIGEERYRMASAMEKAGQWHGAVDKYKEAIVKKASVKDLDASVTRMENEVKADEKVRYGRLALAKKNYDLATNFFKEAKELTVDPANL